MCQLFNGTICQLFENAKVVYYFEVKELEFRILLKLPNWDLIFLYI